MDHLAKSLFSTGHRRRKTVSIVKAVVDLLAMQDSPDYKLRANVRALLSLLLRETADLRRQHMAVETAAGRPLPVEYDAQVRRARRQLGLPEDVEPGDELVRLTPEAARKLVKRYRGLESESRGVEWRAMQASGSRAAGSRGAGSPKG